MKNTILYLLGFPGVGKYTIAQKICSTNSDFVLIDNHKTNNLIFPFIDTNRPIPEDLWKIVFEIRKNLLTAIEKYCSEEKNLIFTNFLCENDAVDKNVYESILRLAKIRGALFCPIRLICSFDELKNRIKNASRKDSYKIIDINFVEQLLKDKKEVIKTAHPNEMTLDITELLPEESSALIFQYLNNIKA